MQQTSRSFISQDQACPADLRADTNLHLGVFIFPPTFSSHPACSSHLAVFILHPASSVSHLAHSSSSSSFRGISSSEITSASFWFIFHIPHLHLVHLIPVASSWLISHSVGLCSTLDHSDKLQLSWRDSMYLLPMIFRVNSIRTQSQLACTSTLLVAYSIGGTNVPVRNCLSTFGTSILPCSIGKE